MNILKRILAYLIWTLTSILTALIYVRIILGPKPEFSTGFMEMFDWLYDVAFVSLGIVIGSIIALLFILADVFYLKRSLNRLVRFLILLVIALAVGTTHYICEKVIDII